MQIEDLAPTFDNYIRHRAFDRARKLSDSAAELVYEQLQDGAEVDGLRIQNMCAKVPSTTVDRVTRVCHGLGMSKRMFIELAVLDALSTAEHALNLVHHDQGYHEELLS